MPQLDQINTFSSQIFWLFFSFAIIYFMVGKMFGPKIGEIIVNRANIISSNVALAEKLKNEAAEIQSEYTKLISGVKAQSGEIKNAAAKQSATTISAEQHKIDTEVLTQISAAEREINASKIITLKELEQNFVTELAQKITTDLGGLNIDKQKIEAALKTLS
jgi:F-type H+-transporting ATPase subunit b